MTHPEFYPVPRWVRATAVVALVLATLLLALGGFVTSFRAGMADPVWPTEPWYLANNFRLDLGYLIEHTHRIAGWVTGAAVSVLALGVWWYEPSRTLRTLGLFAVVGLLAVYGQFHRGMSAVKADQTANWPVVSGTLCGGLALAVLALGLAADKSPGGQVRAAASVALVFVMIQGLLGGFRVFLNARLGTDLAAVHGAFGQLAFCVLVAVVVYSAPRHDGDTIAEPERASFVRLAWALVGVLFVQLVWAVLLRHTGTGLSQRLHILTAFVATGLVVWLAVRLAIAPATRHLKGSGYHLLGILAVQVMLGAEAYVGKFAAAGPHAAMPPELRPVNEAQASIRTAHQLIGAGLLASALALALRAGRTPIGPGPAEPTEETSEPAAEPVAAS